MHATKLRPSYVLYFQSTCHAFQVMPILSYWILASFYDMLDVLNPHFVHRFRITRKVS